MAPLIAEFAAAARRKCETLHTDAEIFNVWASFVAAGERLVAFDPLLPIVPSQATPADLHRVAQGMRLVLQARELVFYITRARVPMPKTTQAFCQRCEAFRLGTAVSVPPITVLPSLPPPAAPLATRAELHVR